MVLPRIPHILLLPALRSSSQTSGSSCQSMNSRKYSAGSQKRRRGRTALARSLLSVLDNQLTEGRAIMILCNASELQALGTGQAVGSARLATAATRAKLAATSNIHSHTTSSQCMLCLHFCSVYRSPCVRGVV